MGLWFSGRTQPAYAPFTHKALAGKHSHRVTLNKLVGLWAHSKTALRTLRMGKVRVQFPMGPQVCSAGLPPTLKFNRVVKIRV